MRHLSERVRVRIGATLFWCGILATAYTLATAITGGFMIRVGGFRFSTHNSLRPIAITLGLGIGAAACLRGDASRLRTRVADALVHQYGLALAVAMAAVTGAACFLLGAHIAYAADASGYLSQARLWRAGNLRVATPAALDADTIHGQQAFTPLGYQPSETRGVVVPGYPPGLPLHFAAVAAVAGERAQFAVPALSAAGIVVVAFLLGRRIGGNETAVIAAAACATSPILLFQAMQPMSDVTAAFWWSLAVLLLIRESMAAAAAAGAAAAIACVVRPNLFAMVPVLIVLATWWHATAPRTESGGRHMRRWAAFLAGPTVAALGLAWLHHALFGSVTRSGYGDVASLFSIEHVWPNLTRYPGWAIHAQSALIVLPLAAPLVVRRVAPEPARKAAVMAWAALVFAAALLVFFLLYLVLDDWFSLRFLLPALPWLLVLQAAVLVAITRALGPPLRSVAVIAVALLIASWGIERARGLDAYRIRDAESRYLEVASFARTLPPDAVFLTLHHSGSLPYYASAAILRWDWLEPAEIDRVVAQLRARRHQVYAVIDDFEEPQFTRRFAGARTLEQLKTPVFTSRNLPGVTSRIYALTE